MVCGMGAGKRAEQDVSRCDLRYRSKCSYRSRGEKITHKLALFAQIMGHFLYFSNSLLFQVLQLLVGTQKWRVRQIILSFIRHPLPCIYLYTHARVGDSQHNDCQRMISCVPSGDTQNPAVFWGMSYYKQLPVEQLKRLAACMVVAGGNLNSAIISGFEMVLLTKDGCVRVDQASTKEL